MNVPEGAARILVDAERVVDWGMSIKLTQDALEILERVAGPAMDDRHLLDGDQFDLSTETWAWYIEWGGPDAGVIPGKRTIRFLFKKRIHAMYFKLLWGGE